MKKPNLFILHNMAILLVAVLVIVLVANLLRAERENRSLRAALAEAEQQPELQHDAPEEVDGMPRQKDSADTREASATQMAKDQQGTKADKRDTTAYQAVLDEALAITASPGGLEYVPAQPLNADDALVSGLANHERILGIFQSFIKLTEKVETSLRDADKAEIGNLEPVFQMIGFSNIWTKNGIAMRELRFIAARQTYEIALLKYRDGTLDQRQMDEETAVYQAQKQAFETFANSTWFAD